MTTNDPHAEPRAANSVGSSDVDRALRLARLSVDRERRARFAAEFERLLSAFASLRQIDVSGVEPLHSPSQRRDVTREDRATPSLSPEELLSNAPDPRDGFFGTPKAIGGDA